MKKANKKELEIVTKRAKWVLTILLVFYIVVRILTKL
jgi:hypothetical protein